MKNLVKNNSISGLKSNRKKRLVALFLSVLMFAPFTAASAEVSGDLTSTTRDLAAGGAGTIKVGLLSKSVQAGDLLTPAEYLALNQVLAGGRQNVILGSLGNAVGGRVDLNHLGPDLSNLVIPRGVTALQNAASALNLTGNLTNSGNLYLYSTNPALNTGAIDANNILNNRGGLLSSVLPSTFANLGAITSLNLDLNALDSIINAGIIRSSGALSLTAGNSIVNSGIASVMSATNNINLIANNITNQGVISSALNNINISALNNNSILLNNLGGKLEALLGAINVRDSLFTAKSNFTLTGGDVLSQTLNINSGDGIVDVNVKDVLGLVNVNAGVVHIQAATPTLQLGTMNITGDPTFYNTTGDVSISADMIFPGQPLAIVAKGDILTTTSGIDINTSDTAGGGSITLIAGANFTSTGPGSVVQPGSGDTLNTLTITGGSTTGGEINLVGPSFATPHLNTFNSSSSAGAAGDITIVAYKGSVAGTGEVAISLLGGQAINATGATANGDVTVIAGGTDKLNNAITIGAINTGGAGTGGSINLTSAKPTIVNGPVTILDGAITAGSFAPGALSVGAIRVTGNATAGDSFSATTLGPVQFDGSVTADGDITVTAGNTISVQQLTTTPGSNGDISLVTTANNGGINLGRDVLADGNVTLQAHGKGSILGLNRVIQTIGQAPIGWAPEPNPTAQGNPNIAYMLGATVSPDGTKVYVPYYTTTGRVYVVNAQTGAIITSITGFNKPQGTAVSPDGSRLFVTNAGSNTVSIVDTTTNTIIDTVSIGTAGVDFAEFVAVSPDGAKIFVLSDQSNPNVGLPGAAKVSVIDVATASVTNTINLMNGASPAQARFQSGAIVVNPQGTTAYVSVTESKAVYAIDLGTNTVSATIDLSFMTTQKPFALAMDPTGTRIYVGEVLAPAGNIPGKGNIIVIDTVSTSANFNKVIANVTLPSLNPPQAGTGSFPQGLSVSPTGTELFAQSTYLDGVSSMYTAPNQVLEFVNVSPQRGPDGYGTTSSAALVVDANGVPHIRLFASNTQNVTPNGINQTLSVIQKPTIQGDNVTLTSGGGNIIVNYDAKGGVMTANTTGTGAVLINNVGTVASTVGASSALGNFFEIGTVHDLTFNGGITSPHVILRSGGTGDLSFVGGANVGKTGGIVDIRTAGGDITQTGVGSLIGKTVTLYSAIGDIGTLANPILTTTGSLSINASTGDSAISNIGTLNLNESAAGGLFSLVNAGNLTVVKGGGVFAPDVNLSTTAGSKGNIVLNAQVGLNTDPGNSIVIQTDPTGKGNITNSAGTFNIVGDSLSLSANLGSFGTTSAPLRTQVSSLNVSNFGNDSVVTNTGAVALTGFNSTLKNFVLKADDDITINGSVNFALNITIQTTANNGDINVNENIGYLPNLLDTVPNVTKLIAHGSGNINELRPIDSTGDNYATTDRGFVRGFFLTLQSDSGNIGDGMPLKTQSNNIKILTSGNADIYGEENLQSLGPYFMNLTGSTANTLNVVAQGRINVTGDLKSNTISLSTLSGPGVLPTDINIGKNVGLAGVGSTTLETIDQANAVPNAGNITWTGGSILSQTLSITTDTGSIGTTSKLVKTAVQDLTANVNGVGNTGNIFITNTGTLDINGLSAGSTIKLLNAGAIDVDGAINAANITLQTSKNGSITLFDNIAATTSLTLNANGTGTIGREVGGGDLLSAPAVALITGKGNIGSSIPGGRIEVTGATTALTTKTTGSVFLDLPTSTVIGLSSAGTTTGIFDVVSDPLANVSLGGNISAANISINSGADILRPLGSTSVLSGKNINLQAAGATIGQAGQAIQTKTANLILTALNGSAYASNTGTLTLGEINIGNTLQTLDIVNKGTLNIGGDIFANGSTVNLTTNSGSGSIYQPTQAFTVSADTLNMSSVTTTAAVGSGSFGKVTAPIQTAVTNFNPSTKGKVFVNNAGAVALNSAFAGSQFNLTASGDVNIAQDLTSKSITINATGGSDIILNANVGVAGALVNLNADDRIDRNGATTITGKTANLVATNGMGTVLLPIVTAVTDLTLSTIGTDIFLDNFSPALNLKTPAVLPNIANVQLSTTGNLVVATNFSGNNIQLSAAGNGNISTTTAGLITANDLQLSTQTGNIGTATALVKVNTSVLSAGVFGASGNGTVGISNAGSPSLQVNASQSRGSFTLVDSSGDLTVDDITTGFPGNELSTKSSLKITEKNSVGTSAMKFTGALDVTGGGIIINNTNVTPGSTITFDLGATVDTLVDKSTSKTNGNIVIAIGKVPTTGVNPGAANFNNPPGTITVNQTFGGQAFAGTVTNAVQGPAGFNATLNAFGRNIIFNSPNADSIILNDGVVITADPPGMGTMSTPPMVPTAQPLSVPNAQVLDVSNTTAASILPTVPALSNFNAAYNTNVATFFPAPVEVPVSAKVADMNGNGDWQLGAENIALFIGDRIIAHKGDKSLKASGSLKPVSYISNGAASSKSVNVPLYGGGTLYAPSKDMDVETPFGTVHIGADAAVLVYVQPGKALSVYNLHDKHSEDVSITANGHEISVAPGTHTTIAMGAVSDFANVNGLDAIAHRNVRSASPAGLSMFSSEFSITSAMTGLNLLQSMRASHDKAQREVVDDILKNAAILMQMGAQGGAYQRVGTKASNVTASN